ncbi:hypothetical protein SDJN02_25484, partial [Cucurbita argyrosperma subsp. argyrosperma]
EFEAGTRPRPTVIGPMGLKYIEHGPLYGPLLNEINGDCTGSAPSSSPFLRVVNCWLTSTVEEISIPRSILKGFHLRNFRSGLLFRKKLEMKFIMEFAENLVLRIMEDPKERDRKFRERLYAVKDRCQKTKEMWSYPLRPYGFWTFDRHNAQLHWDAQISQVPGRRDPYDDMLQDIHNNSK